MLCRRWEEVAWAATREGVRVCRLRIGLVLGRGGGVLYAGAGHAPGWRHGAG